jgi:hypothetical protein
VPGQGKAHLHHGLRSNYAPAFYFHYVLRTFTQRDPAGGPHGMLIDELGDIGPKDAMVALSADPGAIEVKAVNTPPRRAQA